MQLGLTMLQSLGFGYVWLAQGVTGENYFLHMFKQRLTDVFRQDWIGGINSGDCIPSITSLNLWLNQRNILTASDKSDLEMRSSSLE